MSVRHSPSHLVGVRLETKGHALFGLRNAKEITKSKHLADPLSIKAATQIKPQCTAAVSNRFLSATIHLSVFTFGGCVTEDSGKV